MSTSYNNRKKANKARNRQVRQDKTTAIIQAVDRNPQIQQMILQALGLMPNNPTMAPESALAAQEGPSINETGPTGSISPEGTEGNLDA